MARKLVFAVLDSKTGVYDHPMFLLTRGQALRGWTDACNDPRTDMCKYPHDFSLMEIGSYDEDTGRFENLDAPVNLGIAVHFKQGDNGSHLADVSKSSVQSSASVQ